MTQYILPALIVLFVIVLIVYVRALIATDNEIKDPDCLDPAEIIKAFRAKAKKRGERFLDVIRGERRGQ